jgi:hypothetical protein
LQSLVTQFSEKEIKRVKSFHARKSYGECNISAKTNLSTVHHIKISDIEKQKKVKDSVPLDSILIFRSIHSRTITNWLGKPVNIVQYKAFAISKSS